MMATNVVLTRGRKRYTLLHDVTEKEWATFKEHATNGLTENSRVWEMDNSRDVIVVFGPNERPLYTISKESD
jgi:hypothetical protein